MLISVKRSGLSTIIRVKIRDSSVTTGAGLTGLTSASTGLIISTITDNEATPTAYTVAGTNVETITTLGTYQAPTTGKCRFKEVDATNHPGIYELQFENGRFAVMGSKSLLISLSGATNMVETDALIPLSDYSDVPMQAGYPITQNTDTYTLQIDIGVTGLTLTAMLSKNGGTFVNALGTVSEVDYGIYSVSGHTSDSNILGPLVLAMFDTTLDSTGTDNLCGKKEFLVVSYAAGDLSAIKDKTDTLTFTSAGEVNANIQSVNGDAIIGSGTSGDEWGPA